MAPTMRESLEFDRQRMQADRDELLGRIANCIHQDGSLEPLDRLVFRRSSMPVESIPAVMVPCFCVIAQGSKEVYLGEECFRYDPYHYLIATVELPLHSRITRASHDEPYLSFRLELDPTLITSVMLDSGLAEPRKTDVKAIAVSSLDPALLDAVVRLVRLVDSPAEAPFLAPLITREIIYRLLIGRQGDRLRHIAVLGGYTPPVTRAITVLRENFDQPLRIENMARELGMSVSGFHHHFKAVTGMSPLQFQKQLRLLEARRLLLGEGRDAASVGFQVGYQDASQFNREYKRLFGQPPIRDLERLREIATRADVV